MLVSAYQTDILIMCEKEQSEYALDQTEKFIDTLPNHQYPKAEIKLFGEGKKNEVQIKKDIFLGEKDDDDRATII